MSPTQPSAAQEYLLVGGLDGTGGPRVESGDGGGVAGMPVRFDAVGALADFRQNGHVTN